MALPAFLRSLDDRMLGDRLRGRRGGADGHHGDGEHAGDRTGTTSTGTTTRKRDGLPTFLSVFYRVCRLVFLLLALVLVLAIVLILAPANDQNSIVQNVFELAEQVAGPFKDVFTVMDPERMKITNYGLAAAVYFLASVLVTKLPTGGAKRG
jgi:hypothetical protein